MTEAVSEWSDLGAKMTKNWNNKKENRIKNEITNGTKIKCWKKKITIFKNKATYGAKIKFQNEKSLLKK